MNRVYLVRHGQAAFGSDDYDRLTETGAAQCRQLARHWLAIDRRVDRVYAGSLRRQRESAEAFLQATIEEGGDPAPDAGGDRRAFHRHLSRALKAWAAGELRDVEPFPVFRERCAAALAALMRNAGRGSTAVLFGSAGSLAAAMQPALGLGDWELLRLKLTFFNTSVSSLLFDGETVTIESVNAVSHLEQPAFTQLITHR